MELKEDSESYSLEYKCRSGMNLDYDRDTEEIKHQKHKYSYAAQNLKPHRKRQKGVFPMVTAGFFSFITFHWMTSFVWGVYKKGAVDFEEVWPCPKRDGAAYNSKRFERLWQAEVQKKGPKKASMMVVLLRFVRTRVIVSALVQVITLSVGFVAPTYLVKSLLEYNQDLMDTRLWYGLVLVLSLFVLEFLKCLFFVTQWLLNYQTAMKVRGGILTVLYAKMLRLRSLEDKTVGQMVNMFANDGQRLIESCAMAPLVIGGPLVAVATTIYCCIILSPWALVGTAVFSLFYPYQLFIARLTAYLRRRAVVITDRRISLMSEILSSIKLIKFYAWEKAFADKVAGVRSDEREMLEKAAYLNTLSVAFIPMVPVVAAVCTFVAHTLAGNDLSAPQIFVGLYLLRIGLKATKMTTNRKSLKTFSVFASYAMLRSLFLQHIPGIVKAGTECLISLERIRAFTVLACFHMWRVRVAGPLIGTVKALSELTIGAQRFKSVLLMEEREPISDCVTNPEHAVEITNGSFAWDSAESPGGSKSNMNTSEKSKNNTNIEDTTCDPNGAVINGKTEGKRTQGRNRRNEKEKKEEAKPLAGDIREQEKVEVLHSIDLHIPKGKLYGVCGAVGSGKSSLISALLNQMVKTNGKVAVKGSISYVPQQAWIMNETLRDNILFGKDFDEESYSTVLHQCSLGPDLDMLPGEDFTEIGERGINLSGGQKQRVSLARAVYTDSDIYLLDDPLSAVDPHVGQHLFDVCIRGALQGKTVMFVTHQLQYLNQCDHIIHMKDGCIYEEGTHTELMRKDGEYANLIKTFHSEHAKETTDQAPGLSHVPTAETFRLHRKPSANADTTKLIKKEEVEKGAVTLGTYMVYCRACGGVIVSMLVMLGFALPVGCAAFSNWWLSYWISQGSGNTTVSLDHNQTVISDHISDNPQLYMYELVYASTILAVVLTMCLRGFLFMKTTLRASTNLHDRVFSKILRSPMSFFDTTPVGRILNRFAKDMDDIDTKLPQRGETFLQNGFLILTSLVVISVVFPWFLIPLIPMMGVFIFLYRIFRVSLREVKRADNVTRSPWISHITTSIQGLHTINAYGRNKEFIYRYCELMDVNSMLHFLFYYCMRWLSLRLDVLSVLINTVTALFVILLKGDIPTAYAGLALAYSAQMSSTFQVTVRLACHLEADFSSVQRVFNYILMTGMFQFTIRLACEVEAFFGSVERIDHYIANVDSEAASVIKSNRPSDAWPSEGAVTFKGYEMSYRPSLPLVLKGVDCQIRPKEKIGIVGRTGSGKSSLGVGLFRLVEPQSGTILIDNIDISTLGMDDLRSRLSIIPQDPVLFVGTIRYNLDPFEKYADKDLWEALEKCHVKDVVEGLPSGLESPVLENGENFSVGERQLMCMSRALLRHSKILMLDEATAAIDTETDAKIQTTIKEAFEDCTMLTIAHRLNTVLSCDRILVLEEGKIVEFDTPEHLLADPSSKFSAMMSATERTAALS